MAYKRLTKFNHNLSSEASHSTATSPLALLSFLNFQLTVNNIMYDHRINFVKRVGQLS